MAEVPRIVRERLRGQAVAGEHPDANLLSAFSERTLTEPEREQVLDHLSRCAECREVVALAALPQVEEERLVAAPAAGRASVAAGRSWWRSPVIHWSALTAAALVVLIAVGERMRLRREYSASAPAIASYEMAKKQAAPAPPPPPPQPNESQKLAETARAPRQAEAVSPPRSAGGVSGGRITASGSSRSIAAGNAAGPAPPPPPPASAFSSGTANGPPLDKEPKIDQPQTKAVPAPTATTRDALEGARPGGVVARGPLSNPTSESAMLAQRSGANFTRRALLVPRWSVSDSGAVQRSIDGGRSWREVAVAEGVSFRAVAVVVSDVWAGGSGGALFHSSDGGEHWGRVQVQANDRTLSGDIVRIEFADAQNGVVVTSTGETWRTSDAGGTWRQ